MNRAFWAGKRVLLTGHTGFKGMWAALMLKRLGAEVHGLALKPEHEPSLFGILGDKQFESSSLIDLRDAQAVNECIQKCSPELVLHMAAQPLVRKSYREPVETFSTNVMGTVHLLQALREAQELRACLVVTTDKVYENSESDQAFTETDRLGGYDPYAGSKSATEIAVKCFRLSYFEDKNVRLATARGGNVIGGGDFSEDRLVPDIIRAELNGEPLLLRNPLATRPWQHTLDCLNGYFIYLEGLYKASLVGGPKIPNALNIGPQDATDLMTVAEVQASFSDALGTLQQWQMDDANHPHEMSSLSIDSTLAQKTLRWTGKLDSRQAVSLTAEWYAKWRTGNDVHALMLNQIASFFEENA